MLTLKEIQDYKNKMLHETKKQLKNILNREPTKEEIRGLISICKILLTCDGGAYSRYAVTRDKKTGMYYKNRNDCFTQSFAQPADIRGREIKFPERGE